MSARGAPEPPAELGREVHLLLFVAGEEPNSRLAVANLERLRAASPAIAAVEIVDVFADVSRAVEHGILVTPTLLRLAPQPEIRVIGNLSDLARVRGALGLGAEVHVA